MRRPAGVAIGLGFAVTGCGAGSLGGAVAQAPRMSAGAHAATTRPLLVDWGPNDRALLNRSREKGPLVVRFKDGAMQPLFGCQAKGAYAYTAEKSSQVQDDTIDGADELHAKLPAFGAKFEAELSRSGKLNIRMRVVGTYAADVKSFRHEDLKGECTGATHVASHVTVGAFRLFTQAHGSVKGEVSAVVGPSAGGSSESKEQSLNEAGDETLCARGRPDDKQAPDGCSTSLQLVVTPLEGDRPTSEVVAEVGPWVVGGVGALGLVLGAATGAVVLVKRSAATSGCSSVSMTCTPDGQSAAKLVNALGPVTTTGLIVGGVGIAAGGIWLGVQKSKSIARFGIGPTVGGTSWSVEGTW